MAIKSTTNAIDQLGKFDELARKYKDSQAQELIFNTRQKLIDTRLLLVDAKEKLAFLEEENSNLKQQIQELRKSHRMKKMFSFGGLFYMEDDPNPCCSGCWKFKHQVIYLKEVEALERKYGEYKCPVCKTFYGQAKL